MEKVSMRELMSIIGSLRCIGNDEGSGEYIKYILDKIKEDGISFVREKP